MDHQYQCSGKSNKVTHKKVIYKRSLLCDFQIYCSVWQFLNAIQAHSTIVVQFECRHGSAYLVVLSLLESTIQAQLHPKQKQQLLVSPPLQSAAGMVWFREVIARAARGEINFYYQQLQKLQTQPLTDSPLSHSPQSHNKPGPLPSETIIILQTVIDSPTETLNVPRHKTKLKVGR